MRSRMSPPCLAISPRSHRYWSQRGSGGGHSVEKDRPLVRTQMTRLSRRATRSLAASWRVSPSPEVKPTSDRRQRPPTSLRSSGGVHGWSMPSGLPRGRLRLTPRVVGRGWSSERRTWSWPWCSGSRDGRQHLGVRDGRANGAARDATRSGCRRTCGGSCCCWCLLLVFEAVASGKVMKPDPRLTCRRLLRDLARLGNRRPVPGSQRRC